MATVIKIDGSELEYNTCVDFKVKVDGVLTNISNMLVNKNQKYGNSALEPTRIFSKADNIEQLKVRIDDKLSRIKSGTIDEEDTLNDLIGYLVLLKIAQK